MTIEFTSEYITRLHCTAMMPAMAIYKITDGVLPSMTEVDNWSSTLKASPDQLQPQPEHWYLTQPITWLQINSY